MASAGTCIGEAFVCGVSSWIVRIPYDYEVGALVYSCAKASRGELEKVAIKKVNFLYNHGTPIVTYVDTFNRIWLENELCEESNALAAVNAFLVAKQERLIEAMRNCSL